MSIFKTKKVVKDNNKYKIKFVTKRDGTIEDFDVNKIKSAIYKAFSASPEFKQKDFLDFFNKFDDVIKSIDKDTIGVEEIQDLIERYLHLNYFSVARRFIIYREKHKIAREEDKKLIAKISEKLEGRNIKNQNANVDERSYGGRLGEATRVVTKDYALKYCMSDMSRNNHLNNRIYIHDLDSYAIGMHNCLSIPFDDLLANGFNTRQGDVRPANSVGTAFQLVAVIFQLQSLQQFGGVSATHLDWTMVPYVRLSFFKHFRDGLRYIEKTGDQNLEKSAIRELSITDKYFDGHKESYDYAMDMTQKEVYQAVEGLYHNLNTLQSRSGNQLPFTSINYGTCTLPEGRMIIKALLEGSIKGIGKLHKTSIFPCGIFQLGVGINRKPGDPNYDLFKLALESTAKRLYPNYANIDWSGNAGYDKNDPKTYFSTMGCRTANGFDINGFGQLKDGRGNICPVTIILPTIAMEAKAMTLQAIKESDKEFKSALISSFMNYLDTMIHEAREMLIERFNWICKQPPESAKFMYENNVMKGYIPEEGTKSALKHGTLTIGQLGLAEALVILIGADHTTPEGLELAKSIEQLFKDRCAQFKKEDSLNYGVYYTPAENLCYTAMTNFKKKYGEIPGVSDRSYFTNSMHVPVWHKMSPMEKIDIESQLTGYSSAGCITYVELPGSVKDNIPALEEIVNYMMDKDIPYGAINVPNDTCEDCGFTGEIEDACPNCGSKNIKRLRRVTGYLTADYKTSFNPGKQDEVEDRVKHAT